MTDASEATPRGVGPRWALPNGARGAFPSCENLGPRWALPNGARGAFPSFDWYHEAGDPRSCADALRACAARRAGRRAALPDHPGPRLGLPSRRDRSGGDDDATARAAGGPRERPRRPVARDRGDLAL